MRKQVDGASQGGRKQSEGTTASKGGGAGKVLGALAAIAILGFGGYFGYTKFSEAVQEARRAEAAERAAEVAKARQEADEAKERLKLIEEQRKADEEAARQKQVMEPKAGDTKTITLPGGEKMEMIYCPPGSFMMGSPEWEDGRFGDETRHRVNLTKGFWLGKYEVTQAQWKSVMNGNNPSEFKDDNRPVENVSWDDCQKFIAKVNAASPSFNVRLPTEAEWEYACRAGTETSLPSGENLVVLGNNNGRGLNAIA